MNKAIENHPLIGATFVFRPDLPPYDPARDSEPGTLVVGPGHHVTVLAVFSDWNGVEGLEVYWVQVRETGLRTHLTPREIHGRSAE